VVNPAVTRWRSDARWPRAVSQHDLAVSLAAEELEIARRFGAPRALGIALRAEA
jgi:hypothetical protein